MAFGKENHTLPIFEFFANVGIWHFLFYYSYPLEKLKGHDKHYYYYYPRQQYPAIAGSHE